MNLSYHIQSIKSVGVTFSIILFLNLIFFVRVYQDEELKLKDSAIEHKLAISQEIDEVGEMDMQDIQYPEDKPYNDLSSDEKVSYLLHKVYTNENNTYWLANTTLTNTQLQIIPQDFLATNDYDNWLTKNEIFYDPRFTLAVYLNEIRYQLQKKNPDNLSEHDSKVRLPFAWSDWVDLTFLNDDLRVPDPKYRLDCEWLKKLTNKDTKYPDFCKNSEDMSEEELEALEVPPQLIPGFVVNQSPMVQTSQRQAMMQGKSFLLTHQESPLSIVFLTNEGTYQIDIDVDHKKRIVDSNLFSNYIERNKVDKLDEPITLNPEAELRNLLKTVPPRPLENKYDIYKMNEITSQKNVNGSRELSLPANAFHYQQDEVLQQISEYKERLEKAKAESDSDPDQPSNSEFTNPLTRHELNHFKGLEYSMQYTEEDEPTYYKLATLQGPDTGWHYEWRFFDGGLRYKKDKTWTETQLEIREQVILDRLLRNWFRFAQEKGIISWIAHGPLLSWYWDGLMFPFDIDIDIQMPSAELNRLARYFNMTMVVENIEEGFGKYLIDCSTFIHHRNLPHKDNFIDARFIDVDTGTYIDITGVGKNDETPPGEYLDYMNEKNDQGEPIELYMDRRKHWLSLESIVPLRYSQISGVPVYVPNDILPMLNQEYSEGTKSYFFDDYYYVPCVRLWLKSDNILPIFKESDYTTSGTVVPEKAVELIKSMSARDKVRLLETNDEVLIEYFLTQKYTELHELEKTFLMDPTLQQSITDLSDQTEYHHLTSKFKIGKPLRKSLFDYIYFERVTHEDIEEDVEGPSPP